MSKNEWNVIINYGRLKLIAGNAEPVKQQKKSKNQNQTEWEKVKFKSGTVMLE